MAEKIALKLPEKFGILFDGWEDGRGHYYIAIYAVYPYDFQMQFALLAMQPPLEVASFTARAYYDLFISTLHLYHREIGSIIYFLGDNLLALLQIF